MCKTHENDVRRTHRCSCPACCRETDGAVAREHQAINRIIACTDGAAVGSSPASSPDCTAMGESLCWRASRAWIAIRSPEADASWTRPTRSRRAGAAPGAGPKPVETRCPES